MMTKHLKRITLLAITIFALTGVAFAYTNTPYYTYGAGKFVTTTKLVFSADASAVALPVGLQETALFQIEVKSSTDTTVAVTINSELGAELYALASGDYTTANIGQPTGYWWIHKNEVPTITVAGLGAGTLTVKITGYLR